MGSNPTRRAKYSPVCRDNADLLDKKGESRHFVVIIVGIEGGNYERAL